MTHYQLKLSAFEGPLDLLLQLVERRRLEITSISLAAVVEQYVEHLARLDTRDLDAWSEFVVIAARLLLLKSRALLPVPRASTQGPTPDDGLAEQLRRYRGIHAGIQFLRAREQQALRCFARQRRPAALIRRPLLPYRPVELAEAYARAVSRTREGRGVVEAQAIAIGDKLATIQSAVERASPVLFDSLLAQCRNRAEIVVCFLALLELIKQGVLRAEQREACGPIVLYGANSGGRPE